MAVTDSPGAARGANTGAEVNAPETGGNQRSRTSTILHWVLSVAILVGLGIAVARYVNSGEVLAALARFYPHYIPPIIVLSAVYLFLKALWFGIALQPLSGVHMGSVIRAYMAGQPATLIPGGVTARAGLLAEAGVPVATSSAPILLNTLLDWVSFILLALLAALFYEQARAPALIGTGIMLLLIALAAIGPTRRLLGVPLRWVLTRFGAEEQFHRFVDALRKVCTPSILGSGVALTLAGKFILVMILDLSLLGEGLRVAYPPLLLATALPTLLGRLSPLPGGVGPTEVGMVAVLMGAADLDLGAATAGVAIYRVSTIVLQALLGAIVYWFFWKPGREQHATLEHPQMVQSGHAPHIKGA